MEAPPIPRWLIHDEDNRTFVAHTQRPRFFAELVDNGGIDSFVISLGIEGDLVVREWIDDPEFDPEELIPSLILVIEKLES